MEFGILGPLLVRDDRGEELVISSTRLRILLASLLLKHNTLVPATDLLETVWDGRPAAKARATLSSYVMRLRRKLGPDSAKRIRTLPTGYLISVADDEIDLRRFLMLSAAGRQAAAHENWELASDTLTNALRLWRGETLADVPSESLRHSECHRLQETRLQTIELWAESCIRIGNGAVAVAELQRLTEEHPLREQSWKHLINALAETGRSAEALHAYQRLRETLADELGSDPSPPLQRLYHHILTPGSSPPTDDEPQIPGSPQVTAMSGDTQSAGEFTPNPLPPAPPHFTGQASQIADIVGRLTDNRHDVPLVTVSGPPGAGASALVAHVTHRLSQEFKDGVLYADLGGDASRTHAALKSFLQALAPAGLELPVHPVLQKRLCRSLFAGRHYLVVLDNPADTMDVRDLIPAEPGNAVLIASWGRLTALPGAYNVELAMLPPDESLALVAKSIGRDRLLAEPEAAAALIDFCGGLPLALQSVAAKLAARPHWRLADLISSLQRDRADVDQWHLSGLEVRSSFDVRYAMLSESQQTLFKLLSNLDVDDFTLTTAGIVLGDSASRVSQDLETLVDVNMLSSPAPGRYAFHTLLREYAQGLSRNTADMALSSRALHRLFRHEISQLQLVSDVLLPEDATGTLARPNPFSCGETAQQWSGDQLQLLMNMLHHGVGAEDADGLDLTTFCELLQRLLVLTDHWEHLQSTGNR
ncbi:AfsR/SARP family transcriptional regulator [Streptomyces griseofuscus]|uniref:AfsR/SARP family transcriptional regulator n=1 Tax=Streptomyces griseofuscus TaxID=146922 RepID=UPI0037FA960E